MTIHKEGYTSIALCILFIFILNAVIQFYFPQAYVIKWIFYILSFALFIIILQFFRSPTLHVSKDETQVLCPADGKVVVIEETEETEYFKDKRIQISVFMSPINVHINRNPISGVVKYFRYHPGKYLVAWHPKSSTENERTTVVTENSVGVPVLFRQIAGALARRIVWYVKEGDVVEQGQQFGFIKFGSRVDIFLPLGSKVNVNIGDVVKGGKSMLAVLPTNASKDTIPTTPEKAPEVITTSVEEPTEPTLVIEHAAPEKAKTATPKKTVKKTATGQNRQAKSKPAKPGKEDKA